MNKELIKKYKAEFDNWLSGGVLLFKWSHEEPSCWLREDDVISNNLWCHKESDIKYIIIKDEYVEFRKALAEGKTVEVLHYTGYKEFDQNPWKLFAIGVSTFDKPVENYRIKPEEPKFEVGDWVRDIITNKIHQVKNEDICNGKYSQVVKWKPQPGEWCWSTIFGLIKIICETTDEERPCYLCWNPWKEVEQKISIIEPFIGELPTYLQQPE